MKFNKSILVIGDLGRLKVYKVVKKTGGSEHNTSQVSHTQRQVIKKESIVLELVADIDYIEPRKKEDELKSDQMGRFGASTGEEHNMRTEHDWRVVKAISEDIKTIIEKESPLSWYLAFPRDTHNELEGMLSSSIQKTLKKVVPLDLTKIAKEKILSYFE